MKRSLLTERDVLRLAKEGAKALPAGARLTPLAHDRARQLGLIIAGEAGSAATAGTTAPAASPATPGPAAAPRLTIAVGADHGGVALKAAVAAHLTAAGHAVTDVGTNDATAVDYPDFAVAVARLVAGGAAQFGVMVDGAGIGSCMAANKVAGVRAAMCHDITTAQNAREHNSANVLTLGGGLLGNRLALEIVDAFLRTPFGGGRHQGRVSKIDALDATRRS
ncbi:MAG: ribose 5-phosphate isomerase B [Gemmatimonadetes bacterium]|nr:ribose 5-phosphate isomerase B [Gemmatimonadota bacterium]